MSNEPTYDSTVNQVILDLHQMDRGQSLELALIPVPLLPVFPLKQSPGRCTLVEIPS